MIVQRPANPEWNDLVRAFGTPEFSEQVRDLPGTADELDPLDCPGGVILLIFTLAGSCIFIGSGDRSEWSLPMDQIRTGEGIIDAARRVALEQVGANIEPVGVPLCERVLLRTGSATILRWYLVVVAETSASALHPMKSAQGGEARPFDLPPKVEDETMMGWMRELHLAGMRFMRSMDALDGI